MKISVENKKRIALAIICMLIGSFIGFQIGAVMTINWGVSKAVYFLELKGIEFDVNEDELAHGIFQYKNNIDRCYP